MVGRPLDEIFPQTEHEQGELLLVAENISTDTILEDASLKLYKGEILGIAGMVGSGRTELARALFGADSLTSGKITLVGDEAAILEQSGAGDRFRSGIGAGRSQDARAFHVPIGPYQCDAADSVPCRAFWRTAISKRERNRRSMAKQRLSIVMASADQEAQFLSGGNQQKVVLAKWLETNPAIVILDEPTRGVDVGAKIEIYKLMRQLNDRGIAIVMISSELPEVIGMSDRILVMNDGRIVGEVAQGEATEAGIIELATIGEFEGGAVMNISARLFGGLTDSQRLFLRRYGPIFAVYGFIIVLFIIGATQSERFLTVRNLTNVARQSAFLGIVALGQMLVILTAGIDLSIGSLVKLSILVSAIVMDGETSNHV